MTAELSQHQKRALKYAASGGTFHALRPGSNRVSEIEYQYSERGIGIFCDGDEIAALLAAGLLAAIEKEEPIEIDDLIVTHRLVITEAGKCVAYGQDGNRKGE